MKKIQAYIKKKKIPLDYFVNEMGYSKQHICSVLNGRKNPSQAFIKLVTIALNKLIDSDENEFKDLKESIWNTLSRY